MNLGVSDNESAGWWTPTRAIYYACSDSKPALKQSLGVSTQPHTDRKRLADTGANENVLVHPLEEDYRASPVPESELQSGQSLKRR